MVLPVIKVKVSNPVREDLTQEVYLLFDSGSQRSFMNERLAKKLNISAFESETLKLHTFAASDSIQFVLPKAEVNLQLCDGAFKRLCLSVISNMTTKLNMRLKDDYGVTMAGQAVKPDIFNWFRLLLRVNKLRSKANG